ncbi:MAG: hypothetical protein FWE51_05270, partial [Coriobacteriia bacterium]|nr:hypothetical protein [Coriobacteriia bacterium]
HTAPQFEQAAQAGLAAGVDALRISFDPGLDASRIEGLPAAIAALQARATQSSMALFGDGCKEFLKGARLYEY